MAGTPELPMNDQIKINWYRSKVDKGIMRELMRKSDARAFVQFISQLLLFTFTGALAYLAFRNVHPGNWPRTLPLLLLALFVHGTFARFLGGGVALHELVHKTPFRTQAYNDLFTKIYAFIGWWDPVGYRVSHVRHHQVTAHTDEDGEVVLPYGLDWHGIRFVITELTFSPTKVFWGLANFVLAARGQPRNVSHRAARGETKWIDSILPESNAALRREHCHWARIVVFGQLILATLFVITGNWFLIIIVNLGCLYCDWLFLLCGAPQHLGLAPDVSDFRLCTRTFTCGWFVGFLYCNMQYHLEHHMFPAVPFYNLPRLRRAIEHDLPPAPHGLWATWKELLPIMKRQRSDKKYVFVPRLPAGDGERVTNRDIEIEASQNPV